MAAGAVNERIGSDAAGEGEVAWRQLPSLPAEAGLAEGAFTVEAEVPFAWHVGPFQFVMLKIMFGITLQR